jgi:Flp pilus assembly pilin Flp
MKAVLSSLDTWANEYTLILGLLFYVLISKFLTLFKLNLSNWTSVVRESFELL